MCLASLTSNDIDDLLKGYRAAKDGLPEDAQQVMAWREGYRCAVVQEDGK